ncbi:Heterokaryon incompatibility protein 6-OR allele [Apiospora hydei]|uniref:Heterokaryon incompatibility protein 6-OR allele n=1 Tax=Apiospora hydei TaxID=1337664 RepID=A0ABR1VWN5_9PEZI
MAPILRSLATRLKPKLDEQVSPGLLYEPLPRSDRHIRLLELKPGNPNDIVTAKLITHRLEDATDYEALSYTWGNPEEHQTIQCNGVPIRVTPNLFNALLGLRDTKNEITLWVDAICINQQNVEERSHMVSQMPLIYASARRTVCWITSPLSQQAAGLLEDLEEIRNRLSNQRSCITTSDIYHSDYMITAKILEDSAKANWPQDTEAWQHLNSFIQDVYFSRIWIIQDLVCSKSLVIKTPANGVTWETLCSAVEAGLLFSYRHSMSPIAANISVANHFRGNNNTLSKFKDFMIAEQTVMNVSAAISKDLICAPLSMFGVGILSPDTSGININIDFSEPTCSTYTRAALELGHVCLSLARWTPKQDPDLPSWAPDWKSSQVRLLLSHRKSSFCASSRPATTVRADLDSPGTLLVAGSSVDLLAEIACCLPPRRHCDHYNVGDVNILIFDEWFEFVKDRIDRRKGRRATEVDALVQFVETVQAKGCNTIWAPSALADESSNVEGAREFIEFLNSEGAEPTPSCGCSMPPASLLMAEGWGSQGKVASVSFQKRRKGGTL